MASRRTFALAASLVLALPFSPLPTNAAELVSINTAGTATGNGASFSGDLNADGRFVAFTSAATDLVAGSTVGQTNIFVRDLLTGAAVLASVNNFSFGAASLPRLSADGRIVVYQLATCPFPSFCTTVQVFARDLIQGTTTLVSAAMDGTPSSGFSPVISPDGRYVAFLSAASNLVPNDLNNFTDLFVRDLANGTTQLASVNASGTSSGNDQSDSPFFSADGRFVAFTSQASDLVTNDGNGTADVFVRDLVAGTTRLVSVNTAGNSAGSSLAAGISADGQRAVFLSSASDLVSLPDTNFAPDVFVRDLGTSSTQLVSINSAGTGSSDDFSESPSITPNGRFVAFSSRSDDLVPEDTDGRFDIYLRDLETGVTRLVSGGNPEPGFDDSELSDRRVVSDDGRFVTFLSSDTELVTHVTYPCPDCHQVFLRDLQTGAIRILSVTPAGDMAGNRNDIVTERGHAQISQNGLVVLFQNSSTNLAAVPDTNETSDLFVAGSPEGQAANEIPTLGSAGLVLLALLIAGCGALSLRRL